MVSSSESGGILGEGLKRLLGEVFGTSGSGRINIKALHQLLSSLIDLHVRYEGEKQQNLMQIGSPEEGDILARNKPPVVAEIEVRVDENLEADKIDTLSIETSSATDKETSKDGEKSDKDGQNAKSTPVDKTLLSLDGKEDASPKANQTVDDILADKAKDTGGVAQAQPESSTEIAITSISQRSSDFLTKSTTSSSSASHTASTGAKSPSERNVGKKHRSTPLGVAKESSTQTANEFEAILEGCRNHLEVVKEEILSLKARCQSQHEDVLKLAGGLDHLSYRVGTQEPKVAQLETDAHCLGMLVSDYEINFKSITKHIDRHDMKVQEFERVFQRMDKERDALRADLRSANEQVSYLATAKADKMDVQTELNRRALVTDMQQRVPYATFNDTVREFSRTITQLREELHDVDQNLKTVQYELVKGLDAKASTQAVSQIRKQLVEVLSRWQKIEKDHQASVVVMGDTSSAAVAANCGTNSNTSKCLTCGIQTTLEGGQQLVPAKFIPVNRIRHGARNAGGVHTKCVPPEKVFRTGSLGVVKKAPLDEKRTDQHWKA